MSVYGQDWSSYQSATPDTSGISFAFTKVTEGLGYINPKWVSQRDHAKAAGLVWGGYHYPHMGNSVQAEADYFLAQVAWKPGDLVALDWEGYDTANQGVSHAQQLAYKEAWLRYVKKKLPNNRVGMYCSKDYWLNVDTTSYAGDFLWIATGGLPAGQPGIKASWTFHQYSDSPVDKDVANFSSVAALKAWANVSAPAPAPTPAPKPTPAPSTPQWQKLLDHVMSVPEQVYEHWTAAVGWDNVTAWGAEYGEQGVPWCVIWDWCMYNEVGLAGVVPKTDNVADFTTWAKTRGQWSLYPSVGAWVNFDNGGHTEIVTGFDGQRVYTKGGNSIQAGATDSGQGNGVWSHSELRAATRVTGYFAPRFADGQCPPTADPNDPRGGKAVTSYLETDMPLTDADVQKVVSGVLGYKNAAALKANPKLPDVYGYIASTNGAVASLTAQVGALSGAIAALTKAGGITAEQVQAAAQAGAKAALDELAAALGKAGA